MKYIYLLSLLLLPLFCEAQNTFSKIVGYDSLNILTVRNVFVKDSTYFIVNRSRTDTAIITKILNVDEKGDVLTSKTLSNLVLNKDATVFENSEFYFAGQFVPGIIDGINLSKYSALNDELLSEIIKDPQSEKQYFSVQKTFELNNKLYLLGNCNDKNNVNQYTSFLFKINKHNLTLENLVLKNYGTTNNHFKDIYELKDGNLAVFTEYSNADYLRYRGLVFFNKDLEEIGSWFNTGDIIRSTLNFKTLLTKDSLVLMTFVPDDKQKYESLMAYDLEGNKKWEFTLNYFERMTIHSIQESKSNDILIAGKYDRTRIDGLPWVGFVAKLNKQGKLLWLRSVSSFNGKYEYNGREYANPSDFTTFIELEDEHIMAFGSMDDLYDDGSEFPKANSNIWMVKLDPDGCLDQDRCNYDVTVNTINDWYIYDQINVLQKEWIYQVTDKYGNKRLINQKFDGDTMLFDNTFDWRKYHQLVTATSDGDHISTDTLKFRWTREGKLNFMKPWTMYVTYLDSTMYDFTLKQGDSFILPYGFGNANVVKVDSIPLLDGKLRKRLILHHDNEANHRKFGPLTWIEGIGSPNGLIYYYDWINETKTDLLCYFDRGNKRYSITDAPNCDALTRNSDFAKVIHSDNVWYTAKFNTFSTNSSYDRFSFSGDSMLINDKFYFHLRTSIDSIGNSWTLTGKYVREDDGKLWLLDNGQSGEEILIMDMNLTVGDTFAVEDVLGPNTYYVSNTDVITDLAGVARRVIELKCDVNDEFVRYRWIEGIGPDQGVFEANFEQCVIDGSSNLLTCFYTDDIQHYQTSFNLPCWRQREVNVTDVSLLSDINIYPNPGFDQIVIEKGENKNLSYQIFTMTGQMLASGKMNNESKFIISSSVWNSGMYIISISDAKGNYYVGKWVKM